MNKVFTAKFLQHLNKKKAENKEKGFTLIELLVVVIIIGVLAAVALPNLLGQVGKARQSEAKTTVGAINRSQQTERLQNGTFSAVYSLPIGITANTGNNYSFADQGTPSGTFAAVDASARSNFQNDIKDYTGVVGQTASGVFTSLICENNEVAGTGGTAAIDATETPANSGIVACGTNSTAITQ